MRQLIYSKIYKSGVPVIDAIIKDQFDLIKVYTERVRQHQIEAFQKRDQIFIEWDELNYQDTAISCVIDLVRALGKVVVKTDKFLRCDMKVRNGLLQGTGYFKRGGKEEYFETQSIYAGGYDIQCLHIRYLIQTSLPKVKVDKSLTKELKQQQKLIQEKKIAKRQLEGYLRRLKDSQGKVEEFKSRTKKQTDISILDEVRHRKEEGLQRVDDKGQFVWVIGERIFSKGCHRKVTKEVTEEVFTAFRQEQAWSAVKRLLVSYKKEVKDYKERIKDLKERIK